ncbi:MAG: Dodecaprenyl-phosphate galacturonate synthase [Calditrichaeota bacterium]|nr:Dodecaprenyl-phosphate galacturonate synthase [Calditrichota bacterium]
MDIGSLPVTVERGVARDGAPRLSIVIPLFNEVESLPHLKRAIDEMLARERIDAELVFVDDGSRDGSGGVLDEYLAADDRVCVIRFRNNRGKSAALSAGFEAARGEFVATMDADLQDDPGEIPRLIAKCEQDGLDLVSGWKKKRRDPLSKKIPSRFFNFVARLFSRIKIHDFNCGLKVYRCDVVRTFELYGELHRFIPILVNANGWTVGELPVVHHPRRWGKTKFGLPRFLHGFLDLLTVLFLVRYAARPMHLFGGVGLLFGLAGFVILAVLTVEWFVGVPIGNRPLFFLGILLMIVGVQFFTLGLLGEQINHMRQKMERVHRLERRTDDAVRSE